MIIRRPDYSARLLQLVDFFRGERLPRMNDVAQSISFELFGHCVHVIRHDCPSKQPIAFTVEMAQRILDNRSDRGSFQNTGATTAIYEAFETNISILIGLGGREDSLVDSPGEAVSKSKNDSLHDSAAVEVRQVPSLVPTSVRAGRPRSREAFILTGYRARVSEVWPRFRKACRRRKIRESPRSRAPTPLRPSRVCAGAAGVRACAGESIAASLRRARRLLYRRSTVPASAARWASAAPLRPSTWCGYW
jgi:hypothetical protein